MSAQPIINVAVPWSLSHYIPLNGFHPLYRPLFDQSPENITINALSNVETSRRLRRNPRLCYEVRELIRNVKGLSWPFDTILSKEYLEHFWHPNIALTDLLPGQIEFHHTAPFPSFRRPFVFHCESFAPVFFPFNSQGAGDLNRHQILREHYRRIFASRLCLGIFSHIPETLQSLSAFFKDYEIDCKLHKSRVGLSSLSLPNKVQIKQRALKHARFLFVNSANQNPANFFHRGGHVSLRFWKEFRTSGKLGTLYLRCARPSDNELHSYGVDLKFLRDEEGESIIWIKDYLTNHELNALMSEAHFLLIPSVWLHSVSIMQSMALGTVPVVTDTLGTSVYVKDDENGIVLKGVLAASWKPDAKTGILVDHVHRNPILDDQMILQLTQRIFSLLAAPHAYEQMRQNALARSQSQFSGALYSEDFWSKVTNLYVSQTNRFVAQVASNRVQPEIADCLLKDSEWPKVFESPTQPDLRLFTGYGRVSELGGAFIRTYGAPQMSLHDWSVIAEYLKPDAPKLEFAASIRELRGSFLLNDREARASRSRVRECIYFVSRMLEPYPVAYSFGSRAIKVARKIWRYVRGIVRSKNTGYAIQHDIELVRKDVYGFNIIRYLDQYYAVLMSEGQFDIEKFKSNGFSKSFSGNTAKEVRNKIEYSINANK